MDEVKVAVGRHLVGEQLGGFEVMERVNRAGRLGVAVADINHPSRDFLAVVVAVGLRAVEKKAR